MRKAAVYVRVSTDGQTVENQRHDLAQLCRARDVEPVWFEETASAVAKRRPVFAAMMERARRGEFSCVVVWALDRAHRSMSALVADLRELKRVGVTVVSYREPWLDTGGPAADLLVAIFGWVAEQERTRLVERTKAGLERARREGKRIGRPRASPVLLGAAAKLVDAGKSVRQAAATAGVNDRSLRRYLRARTPVAAS